MSLDFQLSVKLVREEDGEFTLLAATIAPSSAFRAGEPMTGTPAGVIVPPTSLSIVLPMLMVAAPPVPNVSVVYHTYPDLRLSEQQSHIAVFSTLGGVVVASQVIDRFSASTVDFSVTVEEVLPANLAAIHPNQEQLTLVQAGIIVQEAVPGPDLPFSTRLDNAIGVSPGRLAAFQEAVFQGVRDRRFTIKKPDIPNSSSSKLSDVRAAVQEKARREA
jgi:hypothetical protein